MNREPTDPHRRREEQTSRNRPPEARRRPGTPRERQRPDEKPRVRPTNQPQRRVSPQERAKREKEKKAREERQRRQRRKAAQKEKKRDQRTPARPLVRRTLLLKLLTMVAVVAALTLGLTIFFKIQLIQVSGNSKYSAQEIIDASGIETGENLLTFGKSKAIGRILAQLPYVGDVQMGIKLPNTVNIDIVELKASYVFQDAEGKWWVSDPTGVLLEEADEKTAKQYPKIKGLVLDQPASGTKLSFKDDEAPDPTGEKEQENANGTVKERSDAALTIMQILSESDKNGNVTEIDVTNLYNMQIWYGDKYQVLLSGPTELSYKIRYMVQAVEKMESEKYGGGVLDLSFQEPGKAIFTPW